jgi:hypothetical protein
MSRVAERKAIIISAFVGAYARASRRAFESLPPLGAATLITSSIEPSLTKKEQGHEGRKREDEAMKNEFGNFFFLQAFDPRL